MIGAQSGVEAAFQEFVYYAGPILQLLYWLTMVVAALWAVLLFKRWVEFQTAQDSGAAKEATVRETLDAKGSVQDRVETMISVDEFVD
ncbi:MAG: hypothetical protein RBS78_04575 [Coriobacteriia bacterium]|jgi:hypothetical protein|nr:hypothetical protein [Coriobacteriia bacterium]